MDVISILQTKRHNFRPHSTEELEWWISEYSAGNIPEFQMAAWLMAVCWHGMTPEETATLTRCMVESGTRLEWPTNLSPLLDVENTVDKHSTGGVGDKISLILGPLVASMGVYVPMMAGRGLGHTGGTIDKLESIPGYRTGLSIPEFQGIVEKEGCSIVAASQELCLADRKLYALRDVTATVSSIALQTASILCKKIAEHPHSLVMDVKYGRGSFQSTREEAEKLATSLIATGEANGLVPTTCLLTHMDSFIGQTVGNWLEMKESIELLRTGKGPSDLVALVVLEAAQMIQQTTKFKDTPWEELVVLCLDALTTGKAYPFFERMVEAHGGDITVCRDPEHYPAKPARTKVVVATRAGYISQIEGFLVGNLCVQLGAGRHVPEDSVDPVAGMTFYKREGDKVEPGDEIALVQTNRPQDVLDRVCATLQDSIQYSDSPVEVPFVVSHKVTNQGMEEFTKPQCLE